MALAKGTNSYADVTEADAYFANRLDVAAWVDETVPANKEKALVTATMLLDEQLWIGTAISETQPLAFPRSGNFFDPRLGINVNLTNDIPDRVVKATFEIAYHLLNNDGLLDDSGRVNSLRVGSVDLNTIVQPNLIPNVAKRLIQPLLREGGSRSWWRAN